MKLCPLSELLDLSDSGVWGDEDPSSGISVLRSTNFNANGTLDLSKLTFRALEPRNRERKLLQAGDILLEKSGGGPKQPVGRVCLFKGDNLPHSFGNFIARLRPRPGVLSEYLFYFLWQFHASGKTSHYQKQTTGIRNLELPRYLSIQVPVVSLDEQCRIVDFLSRAEGIVRLRREAQKKAAEIIPALFLDMFGDPATNPKGWRLNTLGAHVFIPSTVRTPDLVLDADRLCIGADSIESNTGTFLSCLTVREVVPKSGKYWFEERDVLYSKIRPYLAKVALAKTHGYCSADMYPLRSKSTVEPQFLLSLLLSKAFTDFATAESVRAQMPKLNRETLFSFTFPLPPAAIQKKFSVLSEQVQSVLGQQVTASAKAEAIFTALLSRVFSADGLRSLEHAADKADGLELDIPLLGDVLCA